MEDDPATTALHHLAVLISRSLNTLNPNELLAQRVFQLSQTFTDLPAFTKAITSFGKFTPVASSEIYDLCRTQDVLNEAFKVPGLTIVDTDVLAPEEASGRPGLSTGSDKHVFKAPALPRSSQLGLDRLAMEKRREKDQLDKPVVKKIKYEEDEPKQEEFKSAFL